MTLQALVVDDEALARARLCTLLQDCTHPLTKVVAQAQDTQEALVMLQKNACDVVLLDIHMPDQDGIALARILATLDTPPALVFVTAHTEHALQAFELEAVDYLTKPVGLERLQQALQKAERYIQSLRSLQTSAVLVIQDRGRTERIPLCEVLYFKAELKYITVRTAAHSYIWEGALSDLEARYAGQFIRIHRNALIARHAVRALEKHHDPQEGEGWAVRLAGLDELLTVSRRQLSLVRKAI